MDAVDFYGPNRLKQKEMPIQAESQRTLCIVDLFSGCGGLSLGAIEAAISLGLTPTISLAVDFNKKALDVYTKNLGQFSENIVNIDIRKFFNAKEILGKSTHEENKIQKNLPQVDLLLAGPPCQGHSDLNNTSRRADPRNELYCIPVRAAVLLQPRVVLIENVPSVIHAHEKVVMTAMEILEYQGYFTHEFILELTSVGVPQARKRHFLLATKFDSSEVVENLKSLPSKPLKMFEYIADLVEEAENAVGPFVRTTRLSLENKKRIDYLFDNDIYDLPNRYRPKCHADVDHSYVSMYGRMYPDRPAQTITSGFGSMGQGRFVHPTRRRMITAHEAARLQSFPDYFDFSSCGEITALREMIGNAVPPALSAIITSLLLKQSVI